MTPLQQEAVDALKEHGSQRKAADALGISRTALRERIDRAGYVIDPAIQDSMNAVGTGLVPALVWAKTKSEDGTSYSTLLKPPEQDPIDLAERMATVFEGLTPADPVAPPSQVMADICSVYP